MPEFLAYIPTGDKRYRERFGLDFEQFAVGQKFQHRPGLTLSQQDSRDECLDTLNQQMLHFDEQFATHTEWKKCLMDSTLTTKVVIGMTWKTFAKRTRLLGFDEITLTKPAFAATRSMRSRRSWRKRTGRRKSSFRRSTRRHPCAEGGGGNQPGRSDPRVGRLKVVTHGINQRGEVIAKLVYEVLVSAAGRIFFTRINY